MMCNVPAVHLSQVSPMLIQNEGFDYLFVLFVAKLQVQIQL